MARLQVVSPFSSVRAGRVVPGCARTCLPASVRVSRRPVSVRAEESKVVREFDEAKGKTTESENKSTGGTFYNDENPLPPRPELSKEYQKKLKDEYLSLGGSPNRAMGSNYFVWISVVIAVLAVITWLAGYI